ITLTPYSRCRAEFTSLFLAALCSALLIFLSRISLFNPSWIKWPQGFTKQSRLESFNSTRFASRAWPWNRIKPMVKWWFASEGVQGKVHELVNNSLLPRFSSPASAARDLIRETKAGCSSDGANSAILTQIPIFDEYSVKQECFHHRPRSWLQC